MKGLYQDLRYGARVLLNRPVFTLIAVTTLALGIGANTAIFSAADKLLLRQLPVKDPAGIAADEPRPRAWVTGGDVAHSLAPNSVVRRWRDGSTDLCGGRFAVAMVALLACWLPARQATKVNPMVALRNE